MPKYVKFCVSAAFFFLWVSHLALLPAAAAITLTLVCISWGLCFICLYGVIFCCLWKSVSARVPLIPQSPLKCVSTDAFEHVLNSGAAWQTHEHHERSTSEHLCCAQNEVMNVFLTLSVISGKHTTCSTQLNYKVWHTNCYRYFCFDRRCLSLWLKDKIALVLLRQRRNRDKQPRLFDLEMF